MSDYNKFPENACIINANDYDITKDFFTYCIESEESRQCFYEPNNVMKGVFNLRIFWINRSLGLGYGVSDYWKNHKLVFYKFGSDDNWNKFKYEVASQFAGDNS